ncbi:hypothetical protein EV421DRAFT_1506173 [Armillaria borealis]|uniref:Uncharacterized protein n=1 Tax=Armillaria borealis TaxID=47425 RepID=A0AA39MFW5_9AGAR|nr:hypothetical protein EV421DRAFT_1506173 [Armillaria borealis]
MSLVQWLLKAFRRVFFGHAGGRSPLKAILLLWRFFQRLFRRFSRTQDDEAPDKQPQHIADGVLYLPQGVEQTKCTMSLAVDGDTDKPVTAVVCRSTLPNNPRSSHDMAPMSVASPSQTGLAFETDLNPSDGHPLFHGSRPSSISSSSIEGSLYSSSRSIFLRSSQSISSTAYSTAAGAHLNSSHVHLPHARPISGQGELSSDSEAVVVPPPSAAAQGDGYNQDGVLNSRLHDVYPYINAVAPEDLYIFFRYRSVHVYSSFRLLTRTRPRKPYNSNPPSIPPLTRSFPLYVFVSL